MSLVSIITPSLNQAAFLEQTMLSVLQQDYPEIEYIVVDGGSTDGSLRIIRSYAQRLTWWVSEADAGQAEAINKGIAHASGDIVAWLNSDDYYLPGAIRSAATLLGAHPAVDMVYGNLLAVDAGGRTINLLTYGQLSLEDLLCFQIIGQPAVFFRRRAFDEAGGLDVRFHFLLDHQLWIKLARRGAILHANQTWAAARYHAAAKNRSAGSGFGREAFRILDWMSQDPDLAPAVRTVRRRALASAHRVDARYLLDSAQPGAALGAWLHALVTDPPTALSRLNLPASALLELAGLNRIRDRVLQARQKRLSS